MTEKPTRVRHYVLTMICLVYFIAYLDRVNISVVAPAVMQEFGLDKASMGAVFSAFSIGYVLFQIPIGRLGDRLGPRKVLTGLVVTWSVFTAATGAAWNIASLAGARLFVGVGQAGAFPNATRALLDWTPRTGRGFVQGLTQACARFGAAVTPWFVVPVVATWGWRPAFVLCTLVGLVWAVGWFVWYRDNPSEYQAAWQGMNKAERSVLDGGKADAPAKTALPISRLLKSRNMWILCSSYFCYCYSFWIFLTWLPTYLSEARGFSFISLGIFASLPLLLGGLGAITGGWVTDRLMKKTGNLRLSRRLVGSVGLAWSSAFGVAGALVDSSLLSVAFLAASLFGLEMSVSPYWAICMDIGHENSGAVSGMMNSFGSASSIVSPFIFGVIVQYSGSWASPFLVSSGMLCVGALLWLWIDPELSLSKELDLE